MVVGLKAPPCRHDTHDRPIRRVVGGGSSAVEPSDEPGVSNIWLYLNGEPDEEWISSFANEALAADASLRYETHNSQPAIAFTEEDSAILRVIPVADEIIGRANALRQERAAEQRQREGEEQKRWAAAKKIQDQIDRMS